MNKYVKFGIAAIGFIIFFVVIYLLYDNLSEQYKPEQNLVTNGTESSAGSEADGEVLPNGEAESTEETTVQGSAEAETAGESEASGEEETSPAIDFTMEDAAGEEVALYDFVGKPIVMNFWASWCGYCVEELPDFQAAYEKYGEEVEFLMVNVTDGSQETREIAEAFIEEQGYALPFYFDTQLQGTYIYSAYSLPITYFIHADGMVEGYARGMIDADTLDYGISLIFQEEQGGE